MDNTLLKKKREIRRVVGWGEKTLPFYVRVLTTKIAFEQKPKGGEVRE